MDCSQIVSFRGDADHSEDERNEFNETNLTSSLKYDLFSSGKFADATLISSDNMAIPVHRCVLSAASPYFHSLFTSKTVEGISKIVNFNDISFEWLSALLLDIYGRIPCVNDQNITDFLKYADRLQVKTSIWRCINYIIENASTSNCIGIWRMGRFLYYPQLIECGINIIKNNFEDVIKNSEEFVTLETEEIYPLLCEDELNVTNEQVILLAIIKWINHDHKNRIKYKNLLKITIRYAFAQKNLFDSELLKDYETTYKDLIDEFEECLDKLSDTVLPPRKPYEIVMSMGGWSGRQPTKSIQVYNPITSQWYMAPFYIPNNRIYYCSVYYNNKVYFIGGFDNLHPRGLNSLYLFDPMTFTWDRKSSMTEKRCYASAVELNDFIYVLGGYNEISSERFRSVERYDPRNNTWTSVCDMNDIRSDGGAVEFEGKIYAIGGFTGTVIHSSVECYCPVQDDWTYIEPMRHRRSGVSSAVYKKKIYVVGGYNGDEQLSTIERYEPEFRSWYLVASMTFARSNLGLATIGHRLLIMGGYGNDYTTRLCEEYFPETGEWRTTDELPLIDGCSGMRLVTLRGFDLTRLYV